MIQEHLNKAEEVLNSHPYIHQLEEIRDGLIQILEWRPQDPCILAETQEFLDMVEEKINSLLW